VQTGNEPSAADEIWGRAIFGAERYAQWFMGILEIAGWGTRWVEFGAWALRLCCRCRIFVRRPPRTNRLLERANVAPRDTEGAKDRDWGTQTCKAFASSVLACSRPDVATDGCTRWRGANVVHPVESTIELS
jgi:hypothetical protein